MSNHPDLDERERVALAEIDAVRLEHQRRFNERWDMNRVPEGVCIIAEIGGHKRIAKVGHAQAAEWLATGEWREATESETSAYYRANPTPPEQTDADRKAIAAERNEMYYNRAERRMCQQR